MFLCYALNVSSYFNSFTRTALIMNFIRMIYAYIKMNNSKRKWKNKKIVHLIIARKWVIIRWPIHILTNHILCSFLLATSFVRDSTEFYQQLNKLIFYQDPIKKVSKSKFSCMNCIIHSLKYAINWMNSIEFSWGIYDAKAWICHRFWNDVCSIKCTIFLTLIFDFRMRILNIVDMNKKHIYVFLNVK